MKFMMLLPALLLLALGCPAHAASSVEEAAPAGLAPLRLAAPFVPQALPLLHAGESEAFRKAGTTAAFTFWRSPEQLRALVANGQADAAVTALPTAAVLARRGVPCRVLAAYAAPLWLVGPTHLAHDGEPPADTFRRLLENAVLLPFGPGNMPELALRMLAAQAGIDCTPRHCGSAMEALNLLRLGQGSVALLPEPSASIATADGEFAQLLDLRDVWATAFPEHPDMAAACLVAVGPVAHDPSLRALLRQSFAQGMRQMADAPESVLAAAAERHMEFNVIRERVPDGGAALLRSAPLLTGERGKKAVLFVLQQLHELSPSSVGGALPADDFWDMGHDG